jgi:hypothetical protein
MPKASTARARRESAGEKEGEEGEDTADADDDGGDEDRVEMGPARAGMGESTTLEI